MDTMNRMFVTRGQGGRGMKHLRKIKYVIRGGNSTSGGEHTIGHTNAEFQCCAPETYIGSLSNVP